MHWTPFHTRELCGTVTMHRGSPPLRAEEVRWSGRPRSPPKVLPLSGPLLLVARSSVFACASIFQATEESRDRRMPHDRIEGHTGRMATINSERTVKAQRDARTTTKPLAFHAGRGGDRRRLLSSAARPERWLSRRPLRRMAPAHERLLEARCAAELLSRNRPRRAAEEAAASEQPSDEGPPFGRVHARLAEAA